MNREIKMRRNAILTKTNREIKVTTKLHHAAKVSCNKVYRGAITCLLLEKCDVKIYSNEKPTFLAMELSA